MSINIADPMAEAANLGLKLRAAIRAGDTDVAAAMLPHLLGVDAGGVLLRMLVDADTSLAANSDIRLATQKAVKAYVDGIIAVQDAMVFKGVIDCSANPNYPAANAGWTYRVSVSGKIGGGSGVNVQVGDILICQTDATAAGNHATVGAAWGIIQVNIDGALTTADIGVTLQGKDNQLDALAVLMPANGHFTRWTGGSTAVSQAMLGTVSQSGGTPTGAIAERGSGPNGEYVKYFDGRLECTFTDAGVQDTSTAYGNIFGYATSSTWTFPATFIAPPVVSPGHIVISRWLAFNPPTTTTVAYRQYSYATSAAAQAASMKAVGRWF